MLNRLLSFLPDDQEAVPSDRNTRRRDIIVKDTAYVFAAYCITILISAVARYIDITGISYAVLAALFVWAMAITAAFIAVALARKTVTMRFVRAHYAGQFIVWLMTYTVWIYHLGAIRSAGLLFALMAMSFLLPNANLFESYLLAASIAIVQAAVAAFGILYDQQPGSLVSELFYILCFVPAALFISFLTGQYDSQREKARQARIQATAARDVIWKVIAKTADAGCDTLHDALYLVNLIFEYCGAQGGCLFALDRQKRQLDLVFSKLDKSSGGIDAFIRKAGRAAGIAEDAGGETTADQDDDSLCVPFDEARGCAGVYCMANPSMIGSVSEEEMDVIKEILSACAEVLSRSPAHVEPSAPGREDRTVLTASSVEKIEKAISYIRENFTSDISRDGLASHLDISPNYFGKLFAEYTGKKMNDYIIDLRVDEATKFLRDTDRQVVDVAFSVGFNNLRTFNRAFSKNTGMTPQEYRKAGKDR